MRYERSRRLLALLAALTLAALTLTTPARTAPAYATSRLTAGVPAHDIALALTAGAGVAAEIPSHLGSAPDRHAKKLAAPPGTDPHAGADWLRWPAPAAPAWALRATGGHHRSGRAPPTIA